MKKYKLTFHLIGGKILYRDALVTEAEMFDIATSIFSCGYMTHALAVDEPPTIYPAHQILKITCVLAGYGS